MPPLFSELIHGGRIHHHRPILLDNEIIRRLLVLFAKQRLGFLFVPSRGFFVPSRGFFAPGGAVITRI
jgi:hypothetical protein